MDDRGGSRGRDAVEEHVLGSSARASWTTPSARWRSSTNRDRHSSTSAPPIGRTCVTFLHADSNTAATTEISSFEIRGCRCAHFRARSGYHREGGRTKRVHRPSVCALVAWRIHHWLPVVVAGLGMAGIQPRCDGGQTCRPSPTSGASLLGDSRSRLLVYVRTCHGRHDVGGQRCMGIEPLDHPVRRCPNRSLDGRDSHNCRRRVLPRLPRCALSPMT